MRSRRINGIVVLWNKTFCATKAVATSDEQSLPFKHYVLLLWRQYFPCAERSAIFFYFFAIISPSTKKKLRLLIKDSVKCDGIGKLKVRCFKFMFFYFQQEVKTPS